MRTLIIPDQVFSANSRNTDKVARKLAKHLRVGLLDSKFIWPKQAQITNQGSGRSVKPCLLISLIQKHRPILDGVFVAKW